MNFKYISIFQATAVTYSVYTVEGNTSVCNQVVDILARSQGKDGVV